MRIHHRNFSFRPPRRRRDRKAASFGSLLDFCRRYLGSYKWLMILCILLFGGNACAPYLIAFYTRIVVDKVLMVEEYTQSGGTLASQQERAWGHPETENSLPETGMGHSLSLNPALGQPPADTSIKLFWMFILYAGTFVAMNFITRIAQRIRVRLGRYVASALREDMHEKILSLSMSYHLAHTPGRLLSRIVSDVEVIQQQLMQMLILGSRSITMILVGSGILIAVDWRIFIFVLLVMPVFAYFFKKAQVRIKEISRELRHTNSCMYGLASQKMDAIKAIQSYGREKQEQLNFHRLAGCFLRDALNQQRISAGLGSVAQIIQALTTGAIFVLCTKFVLDGEMSVGKMLFVHATTGALFGPVVQLTQLNVVITHLLVVVQRVSSVLNEPLQIQDAPDAKPVQTPLKKGITVHKVTFSYNMNVDDGEDTPDEVAGGDDSNSTTIFRNLNLHIPAGERVCVMGPSGSGKTTLLYLLARLYEPERGGIFYDGVRISKLQTASLRQKVGFVPQEAQIFSGTIRDNICYAKPDAEPKEIIAAAKAAALHDFIMELPVKYETLIGEKGMSLSGGQRQRLSLARALLTEPDILLLDDCTSALDANTEARIQETLTHVLHGKTAVIVSQRVSLAKQCERICTLEDGCVTEMGTHEELVHQQGFYSRLHAQQTE